MAQYGICREMRGVGNLVAIGPHEPGAKVRILAPQPPIKPTHPSKEAEP